jgi:hypothetical protein
LGREINVDSFFNPNGFAIADLLPQDDNFTSEYFIDQILKPLSQEHSAKSADIARRSLRYTLTILDVIPPKAR